MKSFRGLIADDAIETVPLSTPDGSIGYRIVKFQVLANDPAGTSSESTVKIYSVPQTSATGTIDFSDNTMLAAAYYDNSNNPAYNEPGVVIFDNMTFNQDIYITHLEQTGSQPVNYYIELEQIKLDLGENTVATLKDIRNIEGQPLHATP